MFNEVDGFMAGRGLFAANGGLVNSGAMAFAGGADILGDVENTGTIVTSGMSSTVFYDDVVHNGAEIRTSAGSSTVFFGALSGAGSFTGTGAVFVEGDLRPGNSPATVMFAGDLVLGSGAITEVELSGVKPNEFDQLNVAGNLSIGGTLTVVLIDEFELEPDQEFLIADIGGSLTGQFSNYGEGDLVGNFGGIDLFITYGGGDGNDVVLQSLPDNPVLLGDLNEDGLVNLLDITPFVNLIESGGYQAEADCNEDGVVNLLDVNPFIMFLSGG